MFSSHFEAPREERSSNRVLVVLADDEMKSDVYDPPM